MTLFFQETTESVNCTDTSAIPKRRPSHAFINMTGSDGARSRIGYNSSNHEPPIKLTFFTGCFSLEGVKIFCVNA